MQSETLPASTIRIFSQDYFGDPADFQFYPVSNLEMLGVVAFEVLCVYLIKLYILNYCTTNLSITGNGRDHRRSGRGYNRQKLPHIAI